MKLKFLVLTVLLFTGSALLAQSSKKNTPGKKTTTYPKTFTIEKSKFDGLFNYKAKEVISDKTNPYLNKAVLVRSTQTGDMKFLL